TTGGTAVPNADYTPVSGALTFNPGQTSQTFAVPLAGSQARIGQFNVILALSNPAGAVLGTPAVATLTINGPAGALAVSTAAMALAQGEGAAVITVVRLGGSSGIVTVNYASGGGSAVSGVDYAPVSGTLTFLPGVMQASFVLPVLSSAANSYDASVEIV